MIFKRTITKSASLIVASAIENRLKNFNYKVMILKRDKKMRVAPNFHVFPGGKFDLKTDANLDWLRVFLDKNMYHLINKNESSSYKYFEPYLINHNSFGNVLYDYNKRELNSLPFEISMRICAIRETFEETGLLLARKKSNFINEANITSQLIDKDDGFDFKYWLNKIKNDSGEFLNMCLEYDLIPDINSLHEWANWITPTIEKNRFNTVFFTCFLPFLPSEEKLIISKEEISKSEFLTPEELLVKHDRNDIKLLPPTLYEFTRMSKFYDFEKISAYSLQRQKYGLKSWLPKFTDDKLLSILPGDYLYEPMDIDEEFSKKTSSELIKLYEMDKLKNPNLIVNRLIKDPCTYQYKIMCNSTFDSKIVK